MNTQKDVPVVLLQPVPQACQDLGWVVHFGCIFFTSVLILLHIRLYGPRMQLVFICRLINLSGLLTHSFAWPFSSTLEGMFVLLWMLALRMLPPVVGGNWETVVC